MKHIVLLLPMLLLLFCVGLQVQAGTMQGGYVGTAAPDTFGVALPDTLFAGTVIVGGSDSVRIPLSSSSKLPFRIDTVYLDPSIDGFTRVNYDRGDIDFGATVWITLRFHPNASGCRATVLYVNCRRSDGVVQRYRIGVAGCGGIPQLRSSRTRIDFGNYRVGEQQTDSVVLSNAGDYPLTITAVNSRIAGYYAEWSGELILLPGEMYSVRILFAPENPGVYVDTLDILSNSFDLMPIVELNGGGYTYGVELPAMIDWGGVRVGECRDTTLTVRNTGTIPVTFTGLRLVGGSSGFTLGDEILHSFPHTILPNETAFFTIRFCATMQVSSSDMVELEEKDGAVRRVSLRGDGLLPRLWLDTTHAVAGEHCWLSVHLDSGFALHHPPGAYSLRLQVDPFALFPSGEMEATNGTAQLAYTPDGLLTVTGDNREALVPGAVLLRIRFRGLTTGKPENRVAFGQATFDRIGEATVAGDGLILLDGTSEGIGIAERVRIVSVRNTHDAIVVTWRSAQGVHPVLRLFDGIGRMVTRTMPGEGTGEEQMFSLAAGEFAHGWYLLELRDGDVCVTAPVMHTQQ